MEQKPTKGKCKMSNFMVIMVINNLDECTPILEAWEATGIGGITILESSGLGRVRQSNGWKDLPLMPSLSDFLKTPEERHRTIFTVVDSEERVDKLIKATEAIVGDLENPDNGVIFVLPVLRSYGLSGGQKRAAQ